MKNLLAAFVICLFTSSMSVAKPFYSEDEYLNLYYEQYANEVELTIIKEGAKAERDRLNGRINELTNQLTQSSQEFGDLEVEKNLVIENLRRDIEGLKRKSSDDQRLSELRVKDLEARLLSLQSKSGNREKKLIEDQKSQGRRFLEEIQRLKNTLKSEQEKNSQELVRMNNELLQWKQLIEVQSKKLNDIEDQAKSLEDALKKEIKEGSLRVKRLKDRLVINIDDKILFDSGSASLKPEVQKTLNTIADILQKYQKSRIIIEGHTDNIPIHNYKFRDNWQLSSERALSVLNQILKKTELNPHRFSAQGYAEYHPAAPNDTSVGRQQNRRVDIVVLPDH